jgi:hypothetical protein
MSKGCKSALGTHWNLFEGNTSLLYKVNDVVFYDARVPSVADLPMSTWGFSTTLSTGEYFKRYGNLAFTSEYEGRSSNKIVLAPQYFIASPATRNMILVHEVLHSYSGMDDLQLAEELGLPAILRQNTDDASKAISTYLSSDVNCDMAILMKSYGIK